VRRSAIDHWQHLGTSTRRTAEVLRSWLGQQERWQVWRPLDPAPSDATACHLSASTVDRWLDQAGATATAGVAEQLVGVESSGQMATDGLWTRLRGGTKRVVLALVDHVTGVVWPPVVVAGEGTAAAWETLFTRAEQAGLVLRDLRGIASDGATGLESYRRQALPWVSHQRCVFHLWRGLSGALTAAVATAVAAADLTGAAAQRAARQTRRTLIDLIRGVYDAATEAEVQAALARLAAHELGHALAELVAVHLDSPASTAAATTRASGAPPPSGSGGTSASAQAMAATTAPSNASSGRPCSGRSTTTSSLLKIGANGNGTIATPARLPSPSPASRRETSAISMPSRCDALGLLRRCSAVEGRGTGAPGPTRSLAHPRPTRP
jgi:hypothetical protein